MPVPPGLMIAAPASGCGKTTVMLGLLRALAADGLRVSIRMPLPEGGEEVVAKIQSAIEAGTPTITVEDEKGRSYLIRTDRIAYVERGSAANTRRLVRAHYRDVAVRNCYVRLVANIG